MLQPKIKKINVVEPYSLQIEYENGEIRLFDVTPYISGSWYGELKDKAYFKTVRILENGYGIEWADGQDISPHELYEFSINI